MKRDGDLGRHIRYFLGDYLPKQQNASPRTVQSYRDVLKLFLRFAADRKGCSVADLEIEHLDREMVLRFLQSIEEMRGNGASTRNHRLAAIRSLFKVVAFQAPELVEQCAHICAIPSKRTTSRVIDYLTVDEVQAIIGKIPKNGLNWRRDDALVRFLYNTGARVQEALDVRVSDLHLDAPAHVLLRGKGSKERICPLWPDTASRLHQLTADLPADSKPSDRPIFGNRDGHPLTRSGVRYILAKYVRKAVPKCKSLASKNIHPHTMRHTTAMHLLQSGVDINTIRCWLGHASVSTTNCYVEIDIEMKRAALGGVKPPRGKETPSIADAGLLAWLEGI